MITEQEKQTRKQKLDSLIEKFKYAFYLHGKHTSTSNLLKLACFVNDQKPSAYDVFVINEDKSLVFWNP